MKVELSKKEIKVIINFIEYGTMFKDEKEKVNVNNLVGKLRKEIKLKLFKCPICGTTYEGKLEDSGGRCMVRSCIGNRDAILEEVK